MYTTDHVVKGDDYKHLLLEMQESHDYLLPTFEGASKEHRDAQKFANVFLRKVYFDVIRELEGRDVRKDYSKNGLNFNEFEAVVLKAIDSHMPKEFPTPQHQRAIQFALNSLTKEFNILILNPKSLKWDEFLNEAIELMEAGSVGSPDHMGLVFNLFISLDHKRQRISKTPTKVSLYRDQMIERIDQSLIAAIREEVQLKPPIANVSLDDRCKREKKRILTKIANDYGFDPSLVTMADGLGGRDRLN